MSVYLDLNAYCARTNYTGPTTPTLATLRGLHRAHLLSVPFENLDIHLERWISLDPAAIFDKIVTRRRGGFCYEQNGLFAAVLREIGFRVDLLEARVMRADGTPGIPFDHLCLRVTLDEHWLADVGFGDSFREPLRFDDPGEQVQGSQVFRVTHDGTQGRYARRRAATWADEYQFFVQPRKLADFTPGCRHHQMSPESSFTRNRLCSLATPEGRITLSNQTLKIRRDGQITETILPDENAVRAALQAHFGVDLDA